MEYTSTYCGHKSPGSYAWYECNLNSMSVSILPFGSRKFSSPGELCNHFLTGKIHSAIPLHFKIYSPFHRQLKFFLFTFQEPFVCPYLPDYFCFVLALAWAGAINKFLSWELTFTVSWPNNFARQTSIAWHLSNRWALERRRPFKQRPGNRSPLHGPLFSGPKRCVSFVILHSEKYFQSAIKVTWLFEVRFCIVVWPWCQKYTNMQNHW